MKSSDTHRSAVLVRARSLPAVAIEGKLVFEFMILGREELARPSEMLKKREKELTVVKVNGGACGFVARIRATKADKRSLVVEIESDCKSVRKLGRAIAKVGALTLKDILARSEADNPVFHLASVSLPHSACPVRVAIMKAAEVELGLNLPGDVSIEFEPNGNGGLRDAGALDIPSETNSEEGRGWRNEGSKEKRSWKR